MKIKDATAVFASLAQETRLSAFRTLIVAGPKGLAAGDLADRLGVPAPTMSFHLKELAHAGLIGFRKEGRSVIYAADYDGVRGLIDFILSDCCRGDPALCGGYSPRPQYQKELAR